MNKKTLTERWYTENYELFKEYLKKLSKGAGLEMELGFDKYINRWDLRGAPFSSVVKEIEIGNLEHQLKIKTGSLNVKDDVFKDIDFSYAEINNAMFYQCSFDNCLFDHTQDKEIEFYACDFEKCEFRNSNFSYSYMNRNVASYASSFTNCIFYKVDLKESIFTFPLIESCIFEDCKLAASNFDGSRLRNVKFKGKVDSVWFNGYSITCKTSFLWLFNKINPKDFPNEMINIDFSESEIIGAAFGYGINLDNYTFPDDEDTYLYIYDVKKVFLEAIEIINKNWSGDDKRLALSMIEKFYFNKSKQDQKSDFIVRNMMSKDEFSGRFFKLLRELNEKFR